MAVNQFLFFWLLVTMAYQGLIISHIPPVYDTLEYIMTVQK